MPRILELVLIFHNCVSGGQQCNQTFAVGTLCRGLWPTYLALSRIGSHWSSGWSQQSIGSSKAPRNGRGHWHSIQITYKGRRNIMNGSHAIHLSKDKTTGIKVDLVNYTLFGKLRAFGFEIWRFFLLFICKFCLEILSSCILILFFVDLYYNELHILWNSKFQQSYSP